MQQKNWCKTELAHLKDAQDKLFLNMPFGYIATWILVSTRMTRGVNVELNEL